MALAGFRRTRAGRIVARLDEAERTALQDLLGHLVTLVAPEEDPDADPLARLVAIDPDAVVPTDPALARLLPDGYGDDEPEAAAEFRRFTERSLREVKVANARTMLDSLARSGAKVVVSEGEAPAWLAGLNDLRLTIGTRLEIDDDSDGIDARVAELSQRVLDFDPRAAESADRARAAMETLAAFQLYDWLTYLQDSLVRAVTGSSFGIDPDDD